jgi:uncharacterized protein (DUF1015 family)
MAAIIPFSALRYDPKRVSASQVLTQPYDKISPAMQERYYAASPYNLVRIILGRPEPEDNTGHNVYTRAASYFRDWRSQGILRQDSVPSLYVYSQHFAIPGTSTRIDRRGFMALGRIEDYSSKVVFRHEQTLSKPKADRLELLRATHAHFEQLFMLYEDAGEIESALATATQAIPTIEVTDEYGVLNRVWQVSDAAVIDSVRRQMRDQKLIIADGHHRYETALDYRNERRSAGPPNADGAPYNYAVMTLVNINSSGLLVLPTHRVVHGLSTFSSDDFKNASGTYFEVEEVDPALHAVRATAILREKAGTGPALLGVMTGKALLLHRPKAAASQLLAGRSRRQQALDVVQLHKVLLEGVLKLSEDSIRNQQNISYVRDAAEALGQVRTGKANIAFLMNPCKVQQVRDIALAGEVMPQKSTDFYPKLLSGLTIYALD